MKAKINSCLYRAKVTHIRSEPFKRRFEYGVFMFYLDLSELEVIRKKIWLIGYNRFNYFNFRDKDHLQLPKEKPDTNRSVREHLTDYLIQNGMNEPVGKVMLLTNLATLGYQFNPVSFYFIYDKKNNPLCSVVEVGNTYREMKPYFIGLSSLKKDTFKYRTKKLFYVSPFIEHDIDFDFNLSLPSENLKLKIDDYRSNERIFSATLVGNRKALTNYNTILFAVLYPLITLRIIVLIHWQALKIWLQKIHFFRKHEFPELQVDVYSKKTNI